MKKQANKITHTELVKLIIDYLVLRKITAKKVKTEGSMRQNKSGKWFRQKDDLAWKGIADILAFGNYDDKLSHTDQIWIEVKVYPDKQSFDQEIFATLIRDSGNKYILAYSLDDVIEGLK